MEDRLLPLLTPTTWPNEIVSLLIYNSQFTIYNFFSSLHWNYLPKKKIYESVLWALTAFSALKALVPGSVMDVNQEEWQKYIK